MVFQSRLTEEEKQLVLSKAREGVSYSELGALVDHKVSRQRLKQICKKANIDAFALKLAKNEATMAERMVAKWGANWKNKEERKSYIYQTMREKFRVKRANATRKGHKWDLAFGDLEFPTHCPVLGIELNYFNEQISDDSPSFDCVIPERGYVKGNVFIVSQRANRIKNDGTADEHYSIAKFIERNAS